MVRSCTSKPETGLPFSSCVMPEARYIPFGVPGMAMGEMPDGVSLYRK